MTLAAWFSLFTVTLIGAMSPGPSLAVVAKHTLASGRRAGVITAWSHASGIALYALLSLTGLALMLQQSPRLFTVITYGGAAYLAWLGLKSLTARQGVAEALKAGNRTAWPTCAREGALISLLNPKIALFFLALFSQFIHMAQSLPGKTLIVATPFMLDGLWYTFIALVLSQSSVVSKIKQHALLLDRLTGVALLGLAARVVLS